MKNMLRVAAVTPKVHIGSVSGNVREIMDIYEEYKDAADVIVTPELSITGYTCADLFENRKLIDGARRGLLQLAMATCTGQSALVVGLPFVQLCGVPAGRKSHGHRAEDLSSKLR